jgi:hypothetical protein
VSAVALHNLLADRQTNPGTSILLPAVKPLKDDENPLGILRGDANPIVADGKNPPVAVSAGRDMDAGRLGSAELDGVSDQVLKQLDQLEVICHQCGKGIMSDEGPVFLDGYL